MTEPQTFDFRAFHAQFEIAMIVACSTNGVIGREGDLPWHLPDDLRHFMRSTKGCPVVMGRKTYETLERPLPDRLNIVVSGSMTDPELPGVVMCRDLDAAIERGKRAVCEDGQSRPVWIGGGGTIYGQALAQTELVVRTLIDVEVEGDASFPTLDASQWRLEHTEAHPIDDRHAHPFRVEWWIRARS